MQDGRRRDAVPETAKRVSGREDAKPESQDKEPADVTIRALHVRYIVAGNPNTPAEILCRLAHDPLYSVRRRVAENPRTPVLTLVDLARDENVDVRLAVAENRNAPEHVLAELAVDEDVDVRYGLAENSCQPEEILKTLAEDENPYVACRARRTLERIESLK